MNGFAKTLPKSVSQIFLVWSTETDGQGKAAASLAVSNILINLIIAHIHLFQVSPHDSSQIFCRSQSPSRPSQDPEWDSQKTTDNVLDIGILRETSTTEAARIYKRTGVYSCVSFSSATYLITSK